MEYLNYFLRYAAYFDEERVFFRSGTNDLEWRALLYWQAADFAALDIWKREPSNNALVQEAIEKRGRMFTYWSNLWEIRRKN